MPSHTVGRYAHQLVATGYPAWAARGQPYPAVGTELPVRFNLAAAIAAFLEELVKLLPEF